LGEKVPIGQFVGEFVQCPDRSSLETKVDLHFAPGTDACGNSNSFRGSWAFSGVGNNPDEKVPHLS